MIALVGKELRQLAPIAWLWLAILAFGYATRFFTERIDEQTFSGWCDGYCDPGTGALIAAVLILLTTITAYSLFPREHDDSTIDFLRALPLSRGRIFVAKVLAGWLLLCGANVLSYGIDAALLASNPESLGGRFLGQVWWTLLWRDCVFAFVILSHGVLLSWFRATGLVVYALYVLLLMWYESTQGSAGVLSVFGMLANDYEGQRLVVNTPSIVLHVGVAFALLFVAQRLWSRTESAAVGGGAAAGTPSRTRAVLGGLLSAFSFAGLAALMLYLSDAERGGVLDAELATASSEHYRFVYREGDAATVAYLLEHAEADLADIADMLGVTELPLVRVDLTAANEHAAGLAGWKKILMDLGRFEEDISQRRVLAHEMTHVLQSTESSRALARQFATTRFFIEGMAQHVSFEVVPEPARRASNHALAAVAHARQGIRFADLIDDAAFGARFDPELYYSLGDLWTLALVDACGAEVLGDFLRAAGREEASRDIGGERFWRDTFREIGCELDAVNSVWAERMARLLESVDQQRFPEFEDVLVVRDPGAGTVRLEATLSSPSGTPRPPERVVVRVKDDERLSAGVDPVFPGTLEIEGEAPRARFVIPDRAISGERFRYQLGYEPAAPGPSGGAARESVDSRVYYDSWRDGAAPVASPGATSDP